MTERLVQEKWTRARLIMIARNLPFELWGEALKHVNWFQNRCSCCLINLKIPLHKWNSNARIQLNPFLQFWEFEFAFICDSKINNPKNLLPRSESAFFLGLRLSTHDQIICPRNQDQSSTLPHRFTS